MGNLAVRRFLQLGIITIIGVVAAVVPQSALAAVTSFGAGNWSGYSIARSMTKPDDVKILAEVKVPALSCVAGHDTYAAMFVGFGGTADVDAKQKEHHTSLPQAGFNADCIGGQPSYSLWYEWYDSDLANSMKSPSGGDVPLGPGDDLGVSLKRLPNDRWSVIWDGSTSSGVHWSRTQEFGREPGSTARVGDSAECIVERPTGPDGYRTMAAFAPIDFYHCVTYTESNGIHNDIAGGLQTNSKGKVSRLQTTRYVLDPDHAPKIGPNPLAVPELTGQTFQDDASFVIRYKPNG
jgi:hypothetical protein